MRFIAEDNPNLYIDGGGTHLRDFINSNSASYFENLKKILYNNIIKKKEREIKIMDKTNVLIALRTNLLKEKDKNDIEINESDYNSYCLGIGEGLNIAIKLISQYIGG